MSIFEDLSGAASNALKAGAAAARGQGAALKGDFEQLVRPGLDNIVAQVAAIAEDVVAQNIGPEQARNDLQAQMGAVEPLVLAEAELALLSVQVIINAVLDALKSGVNGAIGFALL